MKRTCWIISGGEFDRTVPHSYDYVIACDKGYAHAEKLGVVPDLVIGDFDSYGGDVPEGMNVIALPTAKDDTDTGYAVNHAISLGYDEIIISCALGGRPDHMYSNIQSLCHAANAGAATRIISGNAIIHAVCGEPLIIEKRPGWEFSVFAFSDRCTGVNITGAGYPLSDVELINTFPIGQSNFWAYDEVTVSCKTGTLLVMEVSL